MLSFLTSEIPATFALSTLAFLLEKRFYIFNPIRIENILFLERINHTFYYPGLTTHDVKKIKNVASFLNEQKSHLDEDTAHQILGVYCQMPSKSPFKINQPQGFHILEKKLNNSQKMALVLDLTSIRQLSDKELNAIVAVELAKLSLNHPIKKHYWQKQFVEFSNVLLFLCLGLFVRQAIQYDFYHVESLDFLLIMALALLIHNPYQYYKNILNTRQHHADEESMRFSNNADALISAFQKLEQGQNFRLFQNSEYHQRLSHVELFKFKLA